MTHAQRTLASRLALRVGSLTWAGLPSDAIAMAKRCMLDTVGCALHGGTTAEAEVLRAWSEDLAVTGPCAVWGHDGATAGTMAALLNGAHAHMREFDDVGAGHAGACQVPAVIAAAEMVAGRSGRTDGLTGHDVIVGLIAGHEVASRLADVVGYEEMTRRGWHTAGVYGSLGAAAAVARALTSNEAVIASALGIAGSFSGGLWAFMADGATTKRLHPGKAAETGLTAALLARRGVSGPTQVLEAEWGGLYRTHAPGADLAAIDADFDDEFRIMRKSFKLHPACWGVASAVEAMLEVRRTHGLRSCDISSVKVRMASVNALMVGRRRSGSALEAQMSIAYALACVLVRGRLTLDDFTDDKLNDAVLRPMLERISVTVDRNLHGEMPVMQVETYTGESIIAEGATPRGHWLRPLTSEELTEKFLALADPVLGRDACALADAIWRLEEPEALPELLGLLRSVDRT